MGGGDGRGILSVGGVKLVRHVGVVLGPLVAVRALILSLLGTVGGYECVKGWCLLSGCGRVGWVVGEKVWGHGGTGGGVGGGGALGGAL